MTSWLLMVITLGASCRLTRLVTADVLTEPFRRWVLRVWPPHADDAGHIAMSWPYKLISCPWCIGFWICCAATAAAYSVGDRLWYQLPALALTLSYAVGFLAEHEEP